MFLLTQIKVWFKVYNWAYYLLVCCKLFMFSFLCLQTIICFTFFACFAFKIFAPPSKRIMVHFFGIPIALPRRVEVYPVGREWLELSKPLSCPSMFLCWTLFYRSRRSKQQPYEKEKALCDTLMAHLEKLHKTLLPDVQVSPLPDKDPAPSLSANTGEQQ